MTLKEILPLLSGGLVGLLTLIQIAPIKVNPWSAILEWLGNQTNKALLAKMEAFEADMKGVKAEVETIRDENREIHAKDCGSEFCGLLMKSIWGSSTAMSISSKYWGISPITKNTVTRTRSLKIRSRLRQLRKSKIHTTNG